MFITHRFTFVVCFALTAAAQAANTAPFITGLANQTQSSAAVVGPLGFIVSDAESTAAALSVSAESSNLALLPLSGITLGGSGASRTVTLSPVANQFGTAVVTLTVSDGDLASSLRFTLTINNGASVSGDAPPIIGGISNQVVAVGQKMGPLNFIVSDGVTSNGSLAVAAVSSDPVLTPTVLLGGTSSSRTVTITPAAGHTGNATITLTTTDGSGLTASTAFILTVTSANTAPTISDPANQIIAPGATPSVLNLTVTDAETLAGSLWITARSSNQSLLPDSGLTLGGTDGARTLALAPVAGQTGAATVTLTVTDGGGMSATAQFLFVIYDQGAAAAQFLRPKGVYSLDSTLGGTYNGYSLRDANIRSYSFVDGYVLHVPWDNVEASPGVYDFFIIQNALNKLPAGQKLSLILAPNEPANIATTAGVTTWLDGTLTRAVPWDAYLRQRRDAFLHALAMATFDGVALRDHPRLALINPFLPGGSGGLRDPTSRTLSAITGYTRAKLLGAVQDELRTLTAEFPNTYLQLGFWPIIDSENASYGGTPSWDWLRQQLLAEFNGLTRPHIGFFMDNLAANRAAPGRDPPTGFPATTFGAPLYNSRDAEFNGFEALGPWIQPFKSGTTNSIAINTLNGTPADGLETGYNTFGMWYAEIYAADLDVAAFQPLLQHWHDFYASAAVNPNSDEDGDGLPLWWEQANHLNPRVSTGNDGATGDPDGDRQTNIQEYIAGTDPHNASSRFQVSATGRLPDGSFAGSFPGVSGRTYTVQYSTDLQTWTRLLDITATTTGAAGFTDPAPGIGRCFYRVITPAVP